MRCIPARTLVAAALVGWASMAERVALVDYESSSDKILGSCHQ
jgi:hypothetical protein